MAASSVTVIDLGHDRVKIVTAQRTRAGVEIVGASAAPLPREPGKEPDPVETGDLLRRLLRRDAVPLGRKIVFTLGGRGTMLRYPSVPVVPPWQLKLVMGFEVEELVAAAGGLENIAYDYRILTIPGFDENAFPILVALGQVSAIEERFAVARAAKIPPPVAGLGALGAFNLYRLSPQCVDDTVALLLDVGAEETQLTLSFGQQLMFARTMSTGGRAFTQRLEKSLGLSADDAEQFKRRHAAVLTPAQYPLFDDIARRASDALRGEAAALVTQINGSIRFFANQLKVRDIKPQRLLVTGGGGELAGLPEFLGQQLGLEADRFNAADAVVWKPRARDAAVRSAFHETGAAASDDTPDAEHAVQQALALFATAAGLAAGHVGGEAMTVTLVPPRVMAKRDFWARRVFTGYAGALGVVVLALLGLQGCPYPPYAGYRQAAAERELANAWALAVAHAEGRKNELDETLEENKRREHHYRQLMDRVESGPIVHDALRALQVHTPDHVVLSLVEMAGSIDGSDALPFTVPAGAAKTSPENSDAPAAIRFPDWRLGITGYVVGVGRNRPQNAGQRLSEEERNRAVSDIVNHFVRDLNESGAFANVGLEKTSFVADYRPGAAPAADRADDKTNAAELNRVLMLHATGERGGADRRPPEGLIVKFTVSGELAARRGAPGP